MAPWFTFWDYDSGRDGQIAVGTITSPWFDATGISHVLLRGIFAGGTTVVTVEQNREGPAGGLTGAALVNSATLTVTGDAGASVATPYEFVRIKIVQTTAVTTNAQLAATGLAS